MPRGQLVGGGALTNPMSHPMIKMTATT
jgi:hypothetical protein